MSALKALVVDRDAAVGTLLATLLRVRGVEPALARDGESALGLVHELDPDVIVLGSPVWLRGGDKLVIEALHALSPDLPRRTIVLISHLRSRDLLQRCSATHPCAIVAKPFNIEDIAELIVKCGRREIAATTWIGIDATRHGLLDV